jgi:hypothetical protein
MKKSTLCAVILSVVLAAPSAIADNLTNSTRLLCTAAQASSCRDDGDCVSDTPAAFNIPNFIEVNLTNRTLSTTKSAEEQRVSPIANLTRTDGLIVIQGFEQGRAFNIVINESSGRLSAAVARDGITVSVFGACTPLDQQK